MSNDKYVMWPFGADTPEVLTPTYAELAAAIAVKDRLTILELPALTGAPTLTLDISTEIPNGAILVVVADQDGTGRDITLSTGFEGDGITGTANDKDTLICMYVKSIGAFRVISNHKTTDAA